jgi:1-deoxy-D-xylulose-5-phosphate synthase
MLYTGFTLDGPVAVRYPRGSGPGVPLAAAMSALPVGRAEIRRRSSRPGSAVAILAFGSVLQQASLAGEACDATVVNMRFVKPLDTDLVLQLASEHAAFITIEENVVSGGAGSAVAEALAGAGVTIPIFHLGLPDHFLDHGDPSTLIGECGLDAKGIISAIQRRFPKHRLDDVAKSMRRA